LFVGVGTQVHAQLAGPGYDVNGTFIGDGYSFSLNPNGWEWGAKAGGLDMIYSGLEMTVLDQLYWGPVCIWPGVTHVAQVALDGAVDSAGENLQFDLLASDLGAGLARWTGSTRIPIWNGTSYVHHDVEIRLTFTTGHAAFVLASAVPGISVVQGVGAVLPVSGDFTMHYLVEARFSSGGSWTPSLDFFDAHITPPGMDAIHSFDFGFWYRFKGDCDVDGDVDTQDHKMLADCMNGPGVSVPPPGCTVEEFDFADLQRDTDVDLADFMVFCETFGM
jgi:hypothetical protein